MDAKTIQKYKKYTTKELIKIAERWFNKYIRERDNGKACVSCDGYKVLQAGHFYSAGHYSALRFNFDNVHGQCVQCNMHLSGNLNEYRKRIINRIGENGLKKLDQAVGVYKRIGYKWDRFYLIEVIEESKKRVKEL